MQAHRRAICSRFSLQRHAQKSCLRVRLLSRRLTAHSEIEISLILPSALWPYQLPHLMQISHSHFDCRCGSGAVVILRRSASSFQTTACRAAAQSSPRSAAFARLLRFQTHISYLRRFFRDDVSRAVCLPLIAPAG